MKLIRLILLAFAVSAATSSVVAQEPIPECLPDCGK